MSKVTIKFPRETKYGDRSFSAGEHEFDLDKEPKGFAQRWLSRGCEIVESVKKVEPKKEEPKKEDAPVSEAKPESSKKKTKKRTKKGE